MSFEPKQGGDGNSASVPPPARIPAVPPPALQHPGPVQLVQGNVPGGVAAPEHAFEEMGTSLGQLLVRIKAISQSDLDRALVIQEERGGQIGRILLSLGVCTEASIARALLEQVKHRKKRGGPDVSAAARANPDVAGIRVLTRPTLTVLTLVGVDAFSLLVASLFGILMHRVRRGEFNFTEYYVLGPILALCMVVYLALDLYSPIALSTPEELKNITASTSLVHLAFGVMALSNHLPVTRWGYYERFAWWAASLLIVPVARAAVRSTLSRHAWWGTPVIVLGAAKTGRLVVRTLKAQPRSGLKPVALLDDDPAKHGTLRASFTNEMMDLRSMSISSSHLMTESTRQALADEILGPDSNAPSDPAPSLSSIATDPTNTRLSTLYPRGKFAEVEGVPVVGDLALGPVLAKRLKVPYAIVAMPGVDSSKLLEIVERVGGSFSHLLVIPDLFGFATLGVPAKSVGGILGVEVRQQLLLPWPRFLKRVIDVVATGIGGICILPVLLVIALLVKLDSKGPILYWQKRLGRDGDHFMAAKFRTMHGDGEHRLKAVLDSDPALRAEYEIYHKLRNDPRVTRLGRVLRRYSIDEFPQLWNVFTGDMSLVGPRPYIEREIPEMNGQEKIILRATPGMTGMWQVSDRNATTFQWRVQVDVHYVRNWSPWLDIYILAKTFGVVVKGSGV